MGLDPRTVSTMGSLRSTKTRRTYHMSQRRMSHLTGRADLTKKRTQLYKRRSLNASRPPRRTSPSIGWRHNDICTGASHQSSTSTGLFAARHHRASSLVGRSIDTSETSASDSTSKTHSCLSRNAPISTMCSTNAILTSPCARSEGPFTSMPS